MISPIQQNVVFKGGEAVQGTDKFTGNMPLQQSVRGNYSSAISDILSVQQSAHSLNDTVGKKINTVA